MQNAEDHDSNEQEAAAPLVQKWSHAAEERLRKQFLKECRKECDDVLRKFVDCSKAHTLTVIFKCREQLHEANACLADKTKEPLWIKYRDEKKQAWIDQGLLRPDN